MSSDPRPPVLSMRGLAKRFGGVQALNGVDFEVERGAIHGLIGQNGAGKSTLIKILAGLVTPDAGEIAIDGQPVGPLTPRLAERRGVHVIHQDRLLVPSFTVAEALFLNEEPRFGVLPFIDRRRMRREAERLIRGHFDVALPADALIGDLSAAEQQIVQIVRALIFRPKLLVLDEPTVALLRREVERLFETLRRLRAEGLSIVYISHYLAEIERLCDRVTVLRNGAHVGTVAPKTTPIADIIAMMVARDVDEMFPPRRADFGTPVLQVRDLSLTGAFEQVSFEVRRGEILGLTGLLGAGGKELVRCLFGLAKPSGGSVAIEGRPLAAASPAAAVARGIALLPEDRHAHGVALDLSVRENMTLASLGQVSRAGFLAQNRERQGVAGTIRQLGIQTPDGETTVRNLSGGNQQKVALAKWLHRRSALYILDEPTVGVDIGAKIEIYHLLGRLAAEGAAILVLSTDLIELAGLADRILVLHRGRITREFRADDGAIDGDAVFAALTGTHALVSA